MNKDLFPRDTVQSRLPDPAWLEHWLDRQIQFDGEWEKRVIDDDPAQPLVAVRTHVRDACRT